MASPNSSKDLDRMISANTNNLPTSLATTQSSVQTNQVAEQRRMRGEDETPNRDKFNHSEIGEGGRNKNRKSKRRKTRKTRKSKRKQIKNRRTKSI